MELTADRVITFDRKDCPSCRYASPQGTEAKRIPCPTCHGTGRGSRGGRGGCKRCHGFKTAYDQSVRVPCRTCHGDYHDAASEDRCDYLPAAIVATLPIRVYRMNRDNSWNESFLGLGCVYSCTDYGRANESSDADVIAEVAGDTDGHGLLSVQAINLIDDDNRLCDHIGVFVTRNGYSVRPVFAPDDGAAVAADAVSELTETEATIIGGAVYGAGGNGTMAATTLRVER